MPLATLFWSYLQQELLLSCWCSCSWQTWCQLGRAPALLPTLLCPKAVDAHAFYPGTSTQPPSASTPEDRTGFAVEDVSLFICFPNQDYLYIANFWRNFHQLFVLSPRVRGNTLLPLGLRVFVLWYAAMLERLKRVVLSPYAFLLVCLAELCLGVLVSADSRDKSFAEPRCAVSEEWELLRARQGLSLRDAFSASHLVSIRPTPAGIWGHGNESSRKEKNWNAEVWGDSGALDVQAVDYWRKKGT